MANPVILDIFGKQLEVGDTIAVSFPHAASAVQRVGKILEFSEQNNSDRTYREGDKFVKRPVPPSPVLIVDWSEQYGEHLPSKPSKLTKFQGRIVKITEP